MDPFNSVYRGLTDEERTQKEEIKAKALELYLMYENLPAGREVSIAKTELETSVMWAIKGLTK